MTAADPQIALVKRTRAQSVATSSPPAPFETDERRSRARNSYRFIRAYSTTFTVIASYLTTFFLGRLFGSQWLDERMKRVHAKNASRVLRTIVDLQGLFIKVGQLLSVMANFLPAPFRDGLAGLQDRVPPRPTDEIRQRIVHEQPDLLE